MGPLSYMDCSCQSLLVAHLDRDITDADVLSRDEVQFTTLLSPGLWLLSYDDLKDEP